MKYLNRILLTLVSLLSFTQIALAETAGDITTNNRAAFVSRDGYNLHLGTEGDDDVIVVQNNVTTLSIDGATGAAVFSGTVSADIQLDNNAYLVAKNAAGSGNIDVLKVDATDDTVLNADTGDVIKLAFADTAKWQVDASSITGLVATATTYFIGAQSVDAADSDELCIQAGGTSCEAVGTTARGSKLILSGNEHATRPGEAYLEATGTLRLKTAGGVQLRGATTTLASASGTTGWTYTASSGALAADATNGGPLALPGSTVAGGTKGLYNGTAAPNADLLATLSNEGPNHIITTGGSDFGTVIVGYDQGTGYGAYGPIFGFLKTRSTSATGDGNTIVQSGDILGDIRFMGANGTQYKDAALIRVTVNNTPGAANDMPGKIDFQVSPDGSATLASVLSLADTKAAVFTGTVTSSATGALGWTPVAAANQACNTTCTSACVYGIDSAAPQTWLPCTDATSDMCLCAGAS